MTLLLDDSTAQPVVSSGPSQGVIEQARRKQRARRLRFAAVGVLAAGMLVGALAAFGGRDARHDTAARRPAAAAPPRVSSAGFAVRLSPVLDGGQYGWCVAVQTEPRSGIAGGACGMTPTTGTPIAMRLSEGSIRTHTQTTTLVTTPQVAAVLVDGGERIPTVALPGLPYGLRAVRFTQKLAPTASGTRPRRYPHPAEPTIVPLDARGRAIPEHPPQRSTQPALPGVTHSGGPCALRASGMKGLSAQWSHVASAIAPYPGALVGRAFFSCVDVEYYLHGWPLDAAILLDASVPGAPPAPIPGLQPVAGTPGYFNGPGDFKGELTATRYGDAWLVVAGGSGLGQRIEVLRHLHPTMPPSGT